MIKNFLNQQGKVKLWPAKESARLEVLEYLISKFSEDNFYPESEVNEILKAWHTFDDWALLRRELFNRGYFDRELDGSDYTRTKIHQATSPF